MEASCYTIGLEALAIMALQYGQWVAWEIEAKHEIDMETKTHAVPSWILFACLTLCRPMYVCFNSKGLGQAKSGTGVPM